MAADFRAEYKWSQEHKTHPGPWGQARWYPRQPALSACPTDMPPDYPAQLLMQAIEHPACWDRTDDHGRPLYLYWFDSQGNRFFEAQRIQRSHVHAEVFAYKGYPVEDGAIPEKIAKSMREGGLIDEKVYIRLKRAMRRRKRGG